LINRWAADVVRTPPATLNVVRDAAIADIYGSDVQSDEGPTTPLIVQALLRHAMSDAVSEGIINCLMVTNSSEANVQLTRIHEHLFARKSFISTFAIAKSDICDAYRLFHNAGTYTTLTPMSTVSQETQPSRAFGVDKPIPLPSKPAHPRCRS
jgi:hypothetical protein